MSNNQTPPATPPPPPAAPPASNNNAQNPAAREAQLAQQLVDGFRWTYRFVQMEDRKKQILHSYDLTTKELTPGDVETMQSEMRHSLGASATLKEAATASIRASDILRNDPQYRVREKQVAPLLFEGQEGYCYKRLGISSAPQIECPAPFKELLARCSEEGARSLVLWLGSLLDADSDRSQYLVLYGPGNNGKSSLIDGLVQIFGNAAVTVSASDFLNRFGLGEAANARLLAFDDNNNASFMTSGDFKRVTGSKFLRVERKGKDAYRTRNNLKIVIACNRLPKLTGDDADMRRNVFVKLRGFGEVNPATGKFQPGADGGWVRRLQESLPETLRYCYTQWVEYRTSSGKERVPVPEEAQEELFGITMEAQAEDFINEFLEEDLQGGFLTPKDLHDKAVAYMKMEPKVYEHLKHVLMQKYPLKRANAESPRRYYGVKLRKQATSVDI